MQRIQILFIAILAVSLSWSSKAQNFDPLATPLSDTTQVAPEATAQRVTARQRRTIQEQEANAPKDGISTRAKNYATLQMEDTETAPWRRVVYRQLTADSLTNAPIFRPIRPSGQLKSLFSLLFDLLNQGSISVYEYEDLGYENLTPERILKFEEFLDRFGIVYDKVPNEVGNKAFRILPVDIPTQSIHSYYVKEEYYYDPMTSEINSQIVAICPVMDDEISMEGSVRIPLFWVKYADLQPYLSQQPVMLSTKNNATTATMDDFFSLNLYSGMIAMTLGGETAQLSSEMSDSTALVARQAFHSQIEHELQHFQESLYGSEYKNATNSSTTTSDQELTIEEQPSESDETNLDTARARRSQELSEGKSNKKTSSKHNTSKSKKSRTSKKRAKSEQPKQKKSTTRSVRNRF